MKRIDPDLLLLAEASARDSYYVANGFDAAYDWTDNLGEWAWRNAFDGEGSGVDLKRLRAALTNHGAGFPADTMTFRFINNNDTGPSFITWHGVARTRLAAILLFTCLAYRSSITAMKWALNSSRTMKARKRMCSRTSTRARRPPRI
ncbi:MAG: hypothetical protein ACREV5_05695 [Steroidobacter sp.]